MMTRRRREYLSTEKGVDETCFQNDQELEEESTTGFHTMVDLAAELPSSKVVTTFLNGGALSTWRSLADSGSEIGAMATLE